MKNRHLIPWALCLMLAVAFLLSLQKCSEEIGRADDNLAALTDTVKHFKNKLGTQTASIKTLQLTKKQLQDNFIKKDAELKLLAKEFASIKSVVRYQTITEIDTILVLFKERIPCDFTPKIDSVKTKYYSFAYKLDPAGLQLNKIIIPNEATILTGFKRKWFLGKQTLTTDVTNSNPYIQVTGITSADVVIPEPWYKKWYVWLAAGLVTGAFIK